MACFRFVNGKLCNLLVPIEISLVSSYVAFFRLTYRHSCANAVDGVWSAGLKNDAVCWQ